MHEPYDDYDDYYNDDYDDSHEYDESQSDWNKFYFKFDMDNSPLSQWVHKMMNDIFNQYEYKPIFEFPFVSFPVNSYFSNTGKNKTFQYLGSNYDGVKVWKNKYFISNPINDMYYKHIESNAIHFLKQPHYYRGLFDILN
jgi:hypothetical protein